MCRFHCAGKCYTSRYHVCQLRLGCSSCNPCNRRTPKRPLQVASSCSTSQDRLCAQRRRKNKTLVRCTSILVAWTRLLRFSEHFKEAFDCTSPFGETICGIEMKILRSWEKPGEMVSDEDRRCMCLSEKIEPDSELRCE
jgi:hypothetical protein